MRHAARERDVPPPDGDRFWAGLSGAVARAVVDGEDALRRLVIALLADGHALVEAVTSTGETTLAHVFARALGHRFARVQGTRDLLPDDVTGSSVYETGRFRFLPRPVFANILVIDEINRASPKTQSSLPEPERQVSLDAERHRLPESRAIGGR